MVAFVLCLVVLIAGCSSYAFLSITQQQSSVPITASEWTVYIPQHVAQPQIWLLNPDTSFNSAISFNLDDQSFSALPDLSNGGAINGGGTSDYVTVQDMLYFVDSGGAMGSYDIANSQLASVAPPIPINVESPCLCSDGRYVFVIGGNGGQKNLQVYDPLTSDWIADVPDLNVGRYAQSCIVYQENIFVFGGAGGNAQIETLNIGSPSTLAELTSTLASASWTLLDATSTAEWGAIPVVCNHIDQQYIYLVGGRTNGLSTHHDIIEAFDTGTNTIEPLAFTLNEPRYAPAAVCVNEYIYVFGGRYTNTWERSNALYTPTPQPTDSPTTNVPTTAEPSTSALPSEQPSVLPSEQPSVLPTGDQGGEGQVDEDGEEDGQGDEERNSSMFGGAINSLGSIWMLSALGLALLCCLFCFLFILERRKTSKMKRELEQQEMARSPSGPSPTSATTKGASTAGSSSPLPPPVPVVAMVPPQNPLLASMHMMVPVSSVSMPSHNGQQNIMMAPGSLSQFSGAGLSMEPAQSAFPSSFLSFQREHALEVGEEADGNEGVHNAPLQGGTLQMQQNPDNDVDDIANDEEDYDVDAYIDEVQMTAGAGVNTLGGDEYEYYDADIASDEFVVNDDDGGDNGDYGGTRTKS